MRIRYNNTISAEFSGTISVTQFEREWDENGKRKLNETETWPSGPMPLVVRGTTRFTLVPHTQFAWASRRAAEATERPPLITIASRPTGTSGAPWSPPPRSYLVNPMPDALALLTLAPLSAAHMLGPGLLVRLSHGYESDPNSPGCDTVLGAPASVDLATLIAGVNVAAVTELRLSAAAPRRPESYPPPQAACGGPSPPASGCIGAALAPGSTVATLGPMEVRAFHLRLA